MSAFALIVMPAFLLVILFAADAAAVLGARTAAEELATSIARYIALDAAGVACDPEDPQCSGREAACHLQGVPPGRSYFDEAVVASYRVDAGPGGEVAINGDFDALVGRLPDHVELQELHAETVPATGGAPAGIQVEVTLRRSELLTEQLMPAAVPGAGVSLVDGKATTTIYVSERDAASSAERAPVRHLCT